MKAKYGTVVVLLLAIGISWGGYFSFRSTYTQEYMDLKQKAEMYEGMKAYKRAVPVYEELIRLEPERTEWFHRLQECYLELEWMGEYARLCEVYVRNFPEDPSGYQELFAYWKENGSYKEILSAYGLLPEEIQKNVEIAALYKEIEWMFTYSSFMVEEMGNFYNGFALVKQGKFYGYCDIDGNVVIPAQFDAARPFQSGCAVVHKNGEWFLIDEEGDRIYAPSEAVSELYSFEEGFAVVSIDGKFGYVDTGFQKYAMEYEDATNFHNGVAAVKKDGKWALIGKEWNLITEFIYEDVVIDEGRLCSKQNRIFAKQDGSYELLSLEGEKISALEFEAAYPFYSGPAAVCMDGKWGFVDENGELVLECKYEEAKSFNGGLAPVKIEGRWGYINLEGSVVIPCEFAEAWPLYRAGIALVKDDTYYRCLRFVKFQ